MLRQAARVAGGTAGLITGGWLLRALHGAPAALGAAPSEISAVAHRSPHFHAGVFVNLEPPTPAVMNRDQRRTVIRDLLVGGAGRPPAQIPVVSPPARAVAAPLAVTWYGHSSAVIEIDGYRILTDPIWSDRCSPSRVIGPHRLHPVPAPLEALPAIDAVIISHDHYDHLDIDTITALASSQRCPFLVPLGIGAHLRNWGIPEDRIVELDWEQSARVGELTLICTPARHFSGRFLTRNTTLWSSWAVIGPAHRAFFGGDTGYTKSFAGIGADHGPFDLTLLPVGAYHPGWPDIHMNPEDAVRAHRDVTDPGGGLLVPIHWATFRLAPHPWSEPVQRLLAAAGPAGVGVAVPKPGQRVDPDDLFTFDPWWQS
jgi:L-ascorbate metabolism protein UlaG (beta-lactamase superfamily)